MADSSQLRRAMPGDHIRAVAMVMVGGLVGILGAVIEESQSFPWLVPFVAAPIAEEALKPAGLYFLLGKWPHLLRSQLYTAFLAGVAGISFAVVENLVYLYFYFPQHSQTLVLYRFTVNVFVHALASFIFGLGINQKLVASVKGDIPFLTGSKKYFITAMVIHSVYNTGAFVAEMTGFLKVQ